MRVGKWKRHAGFSSSLTALIGNIYPKNPIWYIYVSFESVLTEFLKGAEHMSRWNER